MLNLKATFFTKNLLDIIACVPDKTASEKKNHGIIPHISHKKNGVSSETTPDRKPISKTNHITEINIIGCIKDHKRPKYEPKYCLLKSFTINVDSKCLPSIRCLKNLYISLMYFTYLSFSERPEPFRDHRNLNCKAVECSTLKLEYLRSVLLSNKQIILSSPDISTAT